MFVYVILSVLLVAVQLRAVRLREARLFKDHYEPCQQAAQLQHTLGPERMNESSCMSGFITQGRPRGFGDEQDSVNDKQSEPCQTSYPGSLCLSCCLAEDSASQPLCLFACLILCLLPFQLPPLHFMSAPLFPLKLDLSSSWPHNWKRGNPTFGCSHSL